MKLKVKLEHPEAKMPTKATDGSAGWDLYAVSRQINPTDHYIEYSLGLSMAIPVGHVGLIFPRSSISKKDLALANAVGVIDSDYRGIVTARFKAAATIPMIKFARNYEVGERVAQLVVLKLPDIELEQATTLDDTTRGTGGFGSTGN